MTAQAALPGTTAMTVAMAICGVAVPSIAVDALDADSATAVSKGETSRPVIYLSQLHADISDSERYVVTGVRARKGVLQASRTCGCRTARLPTRETA